MARTLLLSKGGGQDLLGGATWNEMGAVAFLHL